jgi:hypothetical protein
MAQTLKSKISQMTNAYSIGAIIETAKQVQKENSTQFNVLDNETSELLLDLLKDITFTLKDIHLEAQQARNENRRVNGQWVFRLTATELDKIKNKVIEIQTRVKLSKKENV